MLFSFFCTFSMSVRILRCSASNCSISFSIPQSYSFPSLPNGTFHHIIKRPCKAYFHSLHNFFQTFFPFSLHVSIFIPIFAIAKILMWSTPHKQRARRYVQAQPTLLLMSWAYFFAHTFATFQRLALCLCGALHIAVWRCKRKYTAVRLPRVFLPFVVD
jgi:hypothetical protein